MSISSNINLATHHRDAILNAADGVSGRLETSISFTNINVIENIQNTVEASNRSANGIRVILKTNAHNIYEIGETFDIVDAQVMMD